MRHRGVCAARITGLVVLMVVALSAGLWAKDAAPPVLSREQAIGQGGFKFKIPESWTFAPIAQRPGAFQASGDGVIVRLIDQNSGAGSDGMHVACMNERMTPAMDASPEVKYEYDFAEGDVSGMKVLDSAFSVSYDRPIAGFREWRQRNVTMISERRSLCLIVNVPSPLWKKSKDLRRLVNAVVTSVSLDRLP